MLTLKLFDPQHVTILGLPFLQEAHYQRFPKTMLRDIYDENSALEWLGYHLSGGVLFFETDAKQLRFLIDYQNEPLMNHMAPSGESGFDLYLEENGTWVFYDVIRPFPRQKSLDIMVNLTNIKTKKVMMYTPLYARIIDASIMIDDGESIHPIHPPYKKRIFFYGTSITQGACASRPGLSYTNQLSRMLGVEIINMGFSGNGLGELSIAKLTHLMRPLDMVIIDYDANAGALDKIEDTLVDWIQMVREVHQDIPILILSRIPFNREYFDQNDHKKRIKNKQYQQHVADTMPHVHFIDGETLISRKETEVTVDGIHLNDVGMTLFASRLAPIITRYL